MFPFLFLILPYRHQNENLCQNNQNLLYLFVFPHEWDEKDEHRNNMKYWGCQFDWKLKLTFSHCSYISRKNYSTNKKSVATSLFAHFLVKLFLESIGLYLYPVWVVGVWINELLRNNLWHFYGWFRDNFVPECRRNNYIVKSLPPDLIYCKLSGNGRYFSSSTWHLIVEIFFKKKDEKLAKL